MQTYTYITSDKESYKYLTAHLSEDEVAFNAAVRRGKADANYIIMADFGDDEKAAADTYISEMGLEFACLPTMEEDNVFNLKGVISDRDLYRNQFLLSEERHKRALSHLDAVRTLINAID